MKILFVYDAHTSTVSLQQAIEEILKDYPGTFTLNIIRQNSIDKDDNLFDQAIKTADESDFLFIVTHGGISYFKKFNLFFDRYKNAKKCFFHSGIQDEINELIPFLGISSDDYSTIYKYYHMGGKANLYSLILFLSNAYMHTSFDITPPTSPQWEGIFHPEYDELSVLKRVEERKSVVIAILFSIHHLTNNNTAHIKALIETIEKYNCIAFPIFTGVTKEPDLDKNGVDWVINHYLLKNNQPVADVIINMIGHSLTVFNNAGAGDSDNSTSIFEQLQIPVIQAFSTFFSYKAWKESIIGLDSMALVSGIYMPEMDGQIGGYPIASHEYSPEKGIYAAQPISDRIDKVVRLAINWAHLRSIPESKKKIAIIFHNMPPRNDMIGCAWGLDSPATVFNIINHLKESGIFTEYDFKHGDEIIDRIIQAVSNDTTWKSIEDMLSESVDIIQKETYADWFYQLPGPVIEKMEADWGMAPGDFMVHEGEMPVPGILNGNVFIGLQPPRALDEKADETYHSTDVVCPHQYIAFYKWVKHIFKADFIMHIGTHGTLEWLPGKEKGLSNECYPDITIDDLPHLYVYNISVVGEGIQAKRRSSAVILDHNIPSLTESGTYNQMAQLDDLLKDYFQSVNLNKAKIPSLEKDIWEFTTSLNLHQDLGISASDKPSDFHAFIRKLHSWVEKIKMSVIKDGLHIFGKAPQGAQFSNLLRQLVRIRNGDIMPVNQGIAESLGFNYHTILDNPDEEYLPGNTGHMLIEEWTSHAKNIITHLHENEYTIHDYEKYIRFHIPGVSSDTENLRKTLHFICSELKGRLERLTEELDYTLKGSKSLFVSPGPGGCPTRGNALILPSGKNFFAIDPATLPTRASWDVGQQMAKDLLDRYLNDEQKYPESIAIVLYAGDQMKTNGDDIAEILYLMGIAPVWLGNTNRVTGLEVIPLDKLNRPRIDVTCRISGLFRDTFPNLIEMLDDAVNIVAALDEPAEMNFIRKHVQEDTKELVAKGIDPQVAEQESMIRVFGCPPGNYGGGVDILVENKKWKTEDDLANISVSWSCHVYGNKVHGDKRDDLYTRRLSKTDVTVKNEISIESDIYDIDDEYIYHGGMLTAVKKYSQKKPRSYYGNSADPERTHIADIHEETARVVRARILNPKWIEGLKRHGFKGAQDVSYTMDNVFGWDATADVIEDWMYEEMANHFLFNNENRKWMNEVNPYATHHITERLLEAIQRGMWEAKEETYEKLKQLYLECEGNLESVFSEKISH